MNLERPYRGLTWNHPRGYAALAAAAQRAAAERGGPLLIWDRQELEGFESRPVSELARDYDLLVIDHPHVGEAVAAGCLVPLEEMFDAAQIADWEAGSMGRAMASYAWAGLHWALPLDVAAQVMASRPDLLAGSAPSTWDDVARLSERQPIALSIAGPHALLHLFALCSALGDTPGGHDLLAASAFAEAWRVLAHLHARAPEGTASLNPIQLLEAMSGGDAIALIPLVFGYVNYAVPAVGLRAIAFDNAPTAAPRDRRGSVLGGTGIAVTRRATIAPELCRHLSWLLSEDAQTGFIPDHAGQPSSRSAWFHATVNARWAGFYRRTARTIEDAVLRPRHAGYVAFQTYASALIRQALQGGMGATTLLCRLRAEWHDNLAAAERADEEAGARVET